MEFGLQMTVGKYAGFYTFSSELTPFRICLGWVAFSVQKYDTDAVLRKQQELLEKHYTMEEIRHKMEE